MAADVKTLAYCYYVTHVESAWSLFFMNQNVNLHAFRTQSVCFSCSIRSTYRFQVLPH